MITVKRTKQVVDIEDVDTHYPYKAALMWPDDPTCGLWWSECSLKADSMVIGSGIPGDEKTAQLCARCCNIAYRQALDDVGRLLDAHGVSAHVKTLLGVLTAYRRDK